MCETNVYEFLICDKAKYKVLENLKQYFMYSVYQSENHVPIRTRWKKRGLFLRSQKSKDKSNHTEKGKQLCLVVKIILMF